MATKGPEFRLDGYSDLFRQATGEEPFPFQAAFARDLPSLVDVPTGLGKTAMAVVGWLWRRHAAGDAVRLATPRRLVYCLPMRVLVEQTRDSAIRWIAALKVANVLGSDVPLHVVMGGEDEMSWDAHPERDAIIIGTQDMLLSRALNRGYAASRARWPMHFGLLNTDCLWVFDEIQLMGSGLATTAQLESFRHLLGAEDGNGCKSVWMSATLRPEWLRTVDFKGRIDDQDRIDGKATLSLSSSDHTSQEVTNRWSAKKHLSKVECAMDDPTAIAAKVRTAHKPGTRTIVVVNTVKRACALFEALSKTASDTGAVARKRSPGGNSASPALPPARDDARPASPTLVLLHARFRPPDRAKRVEGALADVAPDSPGTIIVSTQVIEAGVDVSAATLFTELAPWASLVQRFGRCNRRGELNDQASVRWIDLPGNDADAEKVRFPYELDDLRTAAAQLGTLSDVGLGSLTKHAEQLSDDERKALFPHEHTHVIRRKDLIDLFDTTPDLAGNDIDIDRFVREVEESDVRVFWRKWERPRGHEPPPDDKAWRQPGRDELCPAPIGEFKDFTTKGKGKRAVWRWDFTEGRWQRVDDKNAIYPGQTYLVHDSAGGYDPDLGWRVDAKSTVAATPTEPAQSVGLNEDAYDDDGPSKTDRWQTIAEHTDDVCRELDAIVQGLALGAGELTSLRVAARWHDWGKAHKVFQEVLPERAPHANELWAKASGKWERYRNKGRPYFRHELASALAVIQRPHGSLKSLSDDDLNLVAYLIAAHHGKVRLSIRSMPNETRPRTEIGQPRRFARGVWDDDKLPAADLGGGVAAPAVTLSLEPMEIGLCEEPPFAGQPSWMERALRLRDTLGPFRLAYLEALLRAADWRASAARSGGAGVPASKEAAHV